MNRGGWWATVHSVTKLDMTKHAHTHIRPGPQNKCYCLVPLISRVYPVREKPASLILNDAICVIHEYLLKISCKMGLRLYSSLNVKSTAYGMLL